jgi:hypothetical protein
MTRCVLATVLLLTSCSVQHSPSPQAVYRIEDREGGLHLIPPTLPGGIVAKPIPFSQILAIQYGYNPWEQYVDLSLGMRLAVQQIIGKTQIANSYYAIISAGRRGFRIRSLTPDSPSSDQALDQRARYLRLFYQTKFMKSPGQPIRPALCLWTDSSERLGARTTEARQNPDFPCGIPIRDCMAFPGRTTVSADTSLRAARLYGQGSFAGGSRGRNRGHPSVSEISQLPDPGHLAAEGLCIDLAVGSGG